jgi:hypothetical protein
LRPTAWGGRGLLLLVFVLTLPLVTPRLRASDEIEYFAYLRSIVFDQDLDFENEYRHFYALNPEGLRLFHHTFLELQDEVTGRRLNFGPIGSAVLWAPFYLLAHGGVLLARALGAGVAADGYSAPYIAAVSYASALYGLLGLLLVHDLLVRFGRVADQAAALAAAALWLGSPLLYYMTVAPGFSHAPALFVVALLCWLTLRAHAAPASGISTYAAIGLVGGLGALVREQDGLFLVMPGILLLAEMRRTGQVVPGLVRGAVMGLCAFLAFVPQLLVYRSLYGGFHPSPLVSQKMDFRSPHLLQVLFDPAHSLFAWSPLLFLSALGLVAVLAKRRDLPSLLLFAGLFVQIWICGSIQTWSQGGAFGMRRFLSATPSFAWGLAPLVAAALSRWPRPAVMAGLAVFAWWNVSLMIQFGLRLMDRQRLEWPKVAVNQVVEVPPRVARAAWLFFADRERLVREGVR